MLDFNPVIKIIPFKGNISEKKLQDPKLQPKADVFENSFKNEIEKAENFKNFQSIRLLKALSKGEKRVLHRLIKDSMAFEEFFSVISGNKPACLLCKKGGKLDFISKIEDDEFFAQNFAFLQKPHGKNVTAIFFLNKSQTIDAIERNKDLYIYRLRLQKDSSAQEIYQKIASKESPLLEDDNPADITGLTLGYPKYSSMVHHIGSLINLVGTSITENPEIPYKRFLEILESENSPYKDFDAKEIETLKCLIKKYINDKNAAACGGFWQFVSYVDEPGETERMRKAAQDFKENFSIKKFQ